MTLRIFLECANCNYKFETLYDTKVDSIHLKFCPNCNIKIENHDNEILRNAMDTLCNAEVRFPCTIKNIDFVDYEN